MLDLIKEFLATGYNLYYVVAGVVVVIAIIILIAVLVKKSKKKKAKKVVMPAVLEPSYAPISDIDVDAINFSKDEPVGNPNVIVKPPVKSTDVITSVVIKPVAQKKKEKTTPKAPEKPKRLESSFNEPTYSEEHAKRPGIFQIYKDNGGKFRFRVKSSNKETVGHSQGYTTKANCKSGINAVINACKTADVIDTTKEDYVSAVGRATFEVYRDNEMKFRFRLVAANTANILASQGYTAKSNCLNGIKAVKAICINHKVEDTTLINK